MDELICLLSNISIKRYKWWLFIATVFFIIYISLFLYFLTFRVLENVYASDLHFIIVIFIGGIFGEIVSKSQEIIYSIKSWIVVGLYQGLLFFIIYWVGFSILIDQILTKSSPINPFFYMFVTTLGLTIFYFIPSNASGGIIIFLIRRVSKTV